MFDNFDIDQIPEMSNEQLREARELAIGLSRHIGWKMITNILEKKLLNLHGTLIARDLSLEEMYKLRGEIAATQACLSGPQFLLSQIDAAIQTNNSRSGSVNSEDDGA
jgi:hypothetical protein